MIIVTGLAFEYQHSEGECEIVYLDIFDEPTVYITRIVGRKSKHGHGDLREVLTNKYINESSGKRDKIKLNKDELLFLKKYKVALDHLKQVNAEILKSMIVTGKLSL